MISGVSAGEGLTVLDSQNPVLQRIAAGWLGCCSGRSSGCSEGVRDCLHGIRFGSVAGGASVLRSEQFDGKFDGQTRDHQQIIGQFKQATQSLAEGQGPQDTRDESWAFCWIDILLVMTGFYRGRTSSTQYRLSTRKHSGPRFHQSCADGQKRVGPSPYPLVRSFDFHPDSFRNL